MILFEASDEKWGKPGPRSGPGPGQTPVLFNKPGPGRVKISFLIPDVGSEVILSEDSVVVDIPMGPYALIRTTKQADWRKLWVVDIQAELLP